MDIKCPGSGEVEANRWENLKVFRPCDEVKFVLTSEEDYIWAREIIRHHSLEGRVRLLFSPAHGWLEAKNLAEWILRDGLDVRLQLQLHKLVFGPDTGR